ncbi:hypothetical protein ACB092_11G089100 [Castanea dentata]
MGSAAKFRPFRLCTCGKCVCGINQRLANLQAKESVMKFLMGLSESFSQVKTQILLMDPLPSINKAYSLFIQEEMQRSVGSSLKVESIALTAKSQNIANSGHNSKGNERPLCTHCGKLGHTMDKCYKLHGFPPGFKLKSNKNATVHQVSSNLDLLQGNTSIGITNFTSAVIAPRAPTFTYDQYQQLLALIGSCSTQPLPKGQETHVANTVALPSNTIAGPQDFLGHHHTLRPIIVTR